MQSDVDFLVELEQGQDLFDLGELLMDLQDLLQRKVDLVTWFGRVNIFRRDDVRFRI